MWPDGLITWSTFGHLLQLKFAQLPLLTKVGSNFTKFKINPQAIFAKVLKSLAKVVKFRQIWSHWYLLSLPMYAGKKFL